MNFKTAILSIVCSICVLSDASATPQLKMQFTSDTDGSAPSTATAVQGGVSIKPTYLYIPTDTSILVESNRIDSTTNEMFEASKTIQLTDNSSTSYPIVRFDGNTADAASGSAKLRVDLNLMITPSSTGNMFISLKQPAGSAVLCSVKLGMSTGIVQLNNYDAAGADLGLTTIGNVPVGRNFHLQVQLDYSTGYVNATVDNLSYTSDQSISSSRTVTGTFAKNISFGRLDITTGSTSICAVSMDNICITDIPVLPERNVSYYGAVGDGTTNDTAAIANALAALGTSVSKLIFDSGKTYMISQGVTATGKKDFTIEGNGATIKVMNNTPVTSGYWGVMFSLCENFTVSNLTLDGNRAGRVPSEVFAHNIIVSGGKQFRFFNVNSINGVTDGFYVATPSPADIETFPRNSLFKNCLADNCYRQGISIINGHHIIVDGGEYKNTNGTPPQAGIDIESNSASASPGCLDIIVRNVSLHDNYGLGVQISYTGLPRNILVEDCRFKACRVGGVCVSSAYSRIQNNFFEDFTVSTRGIIDFGAANGFNANNKIVSNWFKNIQTSQPVIYIHRLAGDNNELINNTSLNFNYSTDFYIRNATTVVSGNRTALSPAGWWKLDEGTGTAISDSSGNNISGVTYNAPAWVSGMSLNALSFNGINQYAGINDSAILDVTDHFTLAAWIYAGTGTSASEIVIGKSADFRLGYSDNGSLFGLYAPSAIGGWVTTDSELTRGTWHHVVATYNGTKVRLYVDGDLVKEATVIPGSVSTAGTVFIGALNSSGASPFHGTIDDVRIYDIVLSDAEIKNNL